MLSPWDAELINPPRFQGGKESFQTNGCAQLWIADDSSCILFSVILEKLFRPFLEVGNISGSKNNNNNAYHQPGWE